MKNKIAAIVVTYNRLNMLKENIDSLKKQTEQNFDILLIDNNSTDGTKKYIKELNDEKIIYINTGKNIGGAGGFYTGVKEAIKRGYEYAWLMDDDTIPYENALEELSNKAIFLKNNFSFLCSYVAWTDGTPCLMNKQNINVKKNGWYESSNLLTEGLLKILTCTFVSVFINLKIAITAGLPIKEFFIYGDDFEYTYRLSKLSDAYLCFNSKVVHKMKENYGTLLEDAPSNKIGRYFYDERNGFYIARKTGTLMTIRYIIQYFKKKIKIVLKSRDYKMKREIILMHGFYAGLFFNPKIEYINRK